MFTDRYGLPLSTASRAAADAWGAGLDAFLTAAPDVEGVFAQAVAADPDFALGHLGIARAHQAFGRMGQAREALAKARAVAHTASARERAHIDAIGHLIDGRGAEGAAAIRAHLADHPRDALMAQPYMGVFGLIGFSGLPGREAELLAFLTTLAPHYGDDWWFQGQMAFARMEAGQVAQAEAHIERSLAARPDNAHGAHVRAHLYYEVGETGAGRAFLSDWMSGYARGGLMHCHNSWHVALWALAEGDEAGMWAIVDRDLSPEVSVSPSLNILTDLASLYCRADMAGIDVPAERWHALSQYAAHTFPNPGMAFADVHAALAHAMAGQGDALARIVSDAKGPAADITRACAEGFGALAAQDWPSALAHLLVVMRDHARLGGSRAQRDLIEYAVATTLLRMGRGEEAQRLLTLRRPLTDKGRAVSGLDQGAGNALT
ncbi:tetratricopeptide repeat protein [Mesobacterium sp. TK19101]|uniref:Tetratricopeptide repeat protein 38 n=1 Tax=Mesobacterium hydrothermale TaxID=3111907 RepID=A0ABU6HES3_9RHOB|nr:tetratricopeptide repeat protein [Mesobacterium sp. TK19101]MEC3860972.1 tetratricopeptide repeat protein [Mesobacterium sp. TK19101]